MYDFNQHYINACNTRSDINEHLPVLDRLAKDCTHVTEFGVREGVSTIVWLNNDVEVVGYDLYLSATAAQLFTHALAANKLVQYKIRNILLLKTIDETDLLFIDSLHNYEQCVFELANFAHKVKKYIVFHDTVTFGIRGESSTNGLLLAIGEFLVNNLEWRVKEHHINNNGLTVLERN